MLRLRRQILAAVLGMTMALAAGCGTDHHTTVLSPGFVQPADDARYPEGSPARAALQLLRAIQYNDPAAAASFFVPAWRLTTRKLMAVIHSPLVGFIGRDARVISQVLSGRRATLIVAIHAIKRLVLGWEKVRSRWELRMVHFGSLTLGPPAARHRRTRSR